MYTESHDAPLACRVFGICWHVDESIAENSNCVAISDVCLEILDELNSEQDSETYH